MQFKEIAFTGYPVRDMQKARNFYEGVLGLTKSRLWGEDEAPSWVEYDVGSGCLALISSEDNSWPPADAGPAAALEVDDFPGCIDRLKKAGVHFVWEPQETKVCWIAIVSDPDGNRLGIHHRKPA